MSDQKTQLMLRLEAVWWIATAVLIAIVLYPIGQSVKGWPFQISNIVFIVVLVTLTRYIFLLKHTFLAYQQYLKAALIILCIPLAFMLIGNLNGFLVWIEENTWEPLLGHLPLEQQRSMEIYAWNEMLFFGAGSIIATAAFAIRLFMSIWRVHNRGTV
jgi:FlaA1/EpsC-like NDP-sugar epimerase